MGAALGRHHRVDLVEDHRVDVAQDVAGVGRQQQVQRLRRRDQDVGRAALEACALGGRRVAGADGHLRHVVGQALLAGEATDARERRAQVPFDVDRQGLQWRDVQHAAPLPRVWRRLEHQPIDAPQEAGERLAAAGRREQQGAGAGRDDRPALDLGGRRFGERGLEPPCHDRVERLEGRGSARLAPNGSCRSCAASCHGLVSCAFGSGPPFSGVSGFLLFSPCFSIILSR